MRAVAAIPMAADMARRLELDGVLSFADGLVGVLRCSDDAGVNAQVIAGARMLRDACRSESVHLDLQLRGLFLCSHLFPVCPVPFFVALEVQTRV